MHYFIALTERNQSTQYKGCFGFIKIIILLLTFDTSFEPITFINDSDLIVADGAHDEYYLYSPFTKDKIGPFDHFYIYNEDSSGPIGMELQEFEKY